MQLWELKRHRESHHQIKSNNNKFHRSSCGKDFMDAWKLERHTNSSYFINILNIQHISLLDFLSSNFGIVTGK